MIQVQRYLLLSKTPDDEYKQPLKWFYYYDNNNYIGKYQLYTHTYSIAYGGKKYAKHISFDYYSDGDRIALTKVESTHNSFHDNTHSAGLIGETNDQQPSTQLCACLYMCCVYCQYVTIPILALKPSLCVVYKSVSLLPTHMGNNWLLSP